MRLIEISRTADLATITVPSGMTAILLPVPRDTSPAMLTIRVALLPSETIVYAPGLTAGEVAVVPALLASAADVYAPAVSIADGIEVRPDMLASTAAIYVPSVRSGFVTIDVPAPSASAAVYAPTIAPGAVSISPSTLSSSAAGYAPQIKSGAVQASPALLPSGSIGFAPTVTAQASGYDGDASALFSAMTVQPDATRKARINDLVVGLKADGVWTKLDWLVLLAASTAQQALLNWRMPSKVLQSVNSPTFTVDRGFMGDGATSYLSLGEAFNASGNLYALNSASLGVWCNLQGAKTGARPLIGSTQSTRSYIGPANTGAGGARINDSTTLNLGAAETLLGGRVFSRTGAGARAYYRDGVLSLSDTAAATAIATGPAFILHNGTDYADDRVPAAFSGAGLTAAEVQSIHSRINTFLTAIGAN